MRLEVDPAAVKAASEQAVLQAGGRICGWLPNLDRPGPRSESDLIGRALVLNALVNIAFGAPIPIIRNWIEAHGLTPQLSTGERDLLQKGSQDLSEQEMSDIGWGVEALWALLWAGSLTDALPIDEPVPDTMAALCPDLQKNENGAKFTETMRLRPAEALYPMLDLYYRAHWYTEDGRINGYDTGRIGGDVIMERRKALEWLMDDASDWDRVRMNT